MITWRTHEARRYLLYRQGLLGAHRFIGKAGAYDYVRRCGCIQFDPVDVCGKNAELTLQSRERIHGCMKRLARFNGCSEVVYE